MDDLELKAKLFDVLVHDMYLIVTQCQNFEECVNRLLKSIVDVADVSRICVHEYKKSNQYTKTFECNKPGINIKCLIESGFNYDNLHEELTADFKNHEYIEFVEATNQGNPKILNYMRENGIKVLMLIPIRVDEQYWGFMAFSDCVTGIPAKSYELDIFRYLALNISAVIWAQRQYDQVMRLNDQLEQALKIAQKLIDGNVKKTKRENIFLSKMLNEQCDVKTILSQKS